MDAVTRLAFLLALLLPASALAAPTLEWEPLEPIPETLWVAPAFGAEAVGLDVGELAPFTGVLLPPELASYYLHLEDAHEVCVGWAQEDRRGRLVDRSYSSEQFDAQVALTREARRAQGRWFVFGASVGATVVGVFVAVVSAAVAN